MASLKENAITKLATVNSVNMQNGAGAQTLLTSPTGKTTIITHVVIRNVSATLAGGTDFDFTGWKQTVDLSGITSPSNVYRVLHSVDNTSYTVLAAEAAFQITPSTGATGVATATIDVFGYEI